MENRAVSADFSSSDKIHQELCQDGSTRNVMRTMPETWQYCGTWFIHWAKMLQILCYLIIFNEPKMLQISIKMSTRAAYIPV